MMKSRLHARRLDPTRARHSGLAEIAEALGSDLTSFETGDVGDLRAKLARLLALPPHERDELKQRARRVAEEPWSWAHVADRLLEPFT
jgi:glycosyltransferase involved in cell wall biosynthesis